MALFDAARAGASLSALHAAPLVITGVVAPDADSLVSRWCAVVGRRWGDGIETLLAGAPLGIAYATSVRHSAGHIRFAAGMLAFPGAKAAAASATVAPAAFAAPAALAALAPAAAPAVPGALRSEEAAAVQTPPDALSSADAGPDHMAALAAELSRTLRKAA